MALRPASSPSSSTRTLNPSLQPTLCASITGLDFVVPPSGQISIGANSSAFPASEQASSRLIRSPSPSTNRIASLPSPGLGAPSLAAFPGPSEREGFSSTAISASSEANSRQVVGRSSGSWLRDLRKKFRTFNGIVSGNSGRSPLIIRRSSGPGPVSVGSKKGGCPANSSNKVAASA